MVPEHPSQTRERPEPYEQTRAIPAWLAILAVVLAMWGVVYLVLYACMAIAARSPRSSRRRRARREPPRWTARRCS